MGSQKIVRKFAGPIATVVCGSLIFRQNLFVRKETRSDLKETRSNLKSELRAMELRLGSEIEGVKVITVGSAMATIKSLEGKKPMMEMMKGIER